MHIIRDSEKVFSDFGSNPFMAIGGGEPSAKWESDNALNIRKIVEKNCCKCKSKIRNKWFFYTNRLFLKIWIFFSLSFDVYLHFFLLNFWTLHFLLLSFHIIFYHNSSNSWSLQYPIRIQKCITYFAMCWIGFSLIWFGNHPGTRQGNRKYCNYQK